MTAPEDFPGMAGGMEEVWRDLSSFTNLSTGTQEEAGPASEDKPLTWVMPTGRPVTRFVASTTMQEEMQSSLILGSLFVFGTLSVGFRSFKQASVTLVPILLVVVWLYGLMYVAGSSLNIVTVTIATISLGVGIDYCIHVTERYREGRENGETHHEALIGVGGACGLALVGSAASDIAGFSMIALSPMGLFSNFGIFSAAMIALSLIASLVLTTAALGLIASLDPDPAPPLEEV
jgi:predicted RND superfamily exporter protein